MFATLWQKNNFKNVSPLSFMRLFIYSSFESLILCGSKDLNLRVLLHGNSEIICNCSTCKTVGVYFITSMEWRRENPFLGNSIPLNMHLCCFISHFFHQELNFCDNGSYPIEVKCCSYVHAIHIFVEMPLREWKKILCSVNKSCAGKLFLWYFYMQFITIVKLGVILSS